MESGSVIDTDSRCWKRLDGVVDWMLISLLRRTCLTLSTAGSSNTSVTGAMKLGRTGHNSMLLPIQARDVPPQAAGFN